MALRPVDFGVPQSRPSVIEAAFGVALAELARNAIGAPFERRAAERASKIAIKQSQEITEFNEALRLRNIVPEGLARGRAATKVQIQSGALVPFNDSLAAEFQQARMGAPAVVIDENVSYVPAEQVALARQRNQLADPFMARILNRSRTIINTAKPTSSTGALVDNRGRPLEGAEPDQLVTQGEVMDAGRNLVSTDAILSRGSAEELAAAQREATRAQRDLATQLAPPPEGYGGGMMIPAYDGDGTGIGAGRRRPLTSAERAANYNVARLPLMIQQAGSESMKAELREQLNLARRVDREAIRVPIIGQQELTELTNTYRQLGSDQARTVRGMAAWLHGNDLLYDERGRKINEIDGAGTTAVANRRGLLEAIIASDIYPDMRSYEEGTRGGGARLGAEALGWLGRIYRARGHSNWRHPDAAAPVGVPPVDGDTVQFRRVDPENPNSAQSLLTPDSNAASNLLPAGRAVGQVNNSTGLTNVFQLSRQRLTNNPGALSALRAELAAITTPDALAAYIRRAGLAVPDSVFSGLTTGSDTQRRINMQHYLSLVNAALAEGIANP